MLWRLQLYPATYTFIFIYINCQTLHQVKADRFVCWEINKEYREAKRCSKINAICPCVHRVQCKILACSCLLICVIWSSIYDIIKKDCQTMVNKAKYLKPWKLINYEKRQLTFPVFLSVTLFHPFLLSTLLVGLFLVLLMFVHGKQLADSHPTLDRLKKPDLHNDDNLWRVIRDRDKRNGWGWRPLTLSLWVLCFMVCNKRLTS